MLDDARRLDEMLTRLAALAQLRGPSMHAGIAALIDATLERFGPPTAAAPEQAPDEDEHD